MKRFIKDIRKYIDYAVYAAKSSLKAEVANSRLNWLWWVLEPLLFMLVYMFIGNIVYGKGESNFALFVFIGLTAWDTQKLRQLGGITGPDSVTLSKYVILGALTLYLDFINLFLMLLRLFGDRK